MADNKYDLSSFDKAKDSAQKYDLSAFDKAANPNAEGVSKLESLLRGGAQGATFGFADELAGAGEALLDKLSGKDKDLGDLYRQHRDESRLNFKNAQEANPLTYGGGNFAGGLASMAIPIIGPGAKILQGAGGLGGALRVGAAAGALGGLGSSDADITQDNVGQAVRDTLDGAGVGMATAGVMHGGISGASKVLGGLGKLNISKNIKDSFNYGKNDVDLITKAGIEAAEDKATEATQKLGLMSRSVNKSAGEAQGAAQNKARQTIQDLEVNPEIKKLQDLIERLKASRNPKAQQSISKIQDLLDLQLQGPIKTSEGLHSVLNPSEIIPEQASALEKLQQKASLANRNAELLGQDVSSHIIPGEDEQGNKLLSLLQKTDENIGSTEKLQPILDSEGKPTGEFKIADIGDNNVTKAKVNTVFDTPGSPEQIIPGDKGRLATKPITYRSGGLDPNKSSYKDVEDFLSAINDSNGIKDSENLSGDAVRTLRQVGGDLSEKLRTDPTVAKSIDNTRLSHQALDTLGLDPKMAWEGGDFQKGVDGAVELTQLAKSKLKNSVRNFEEVTKAGMNAQDKLSAGLDLLKHVDPKAVAGIEPEISDASRRLYLSRQAQGFNYQNRSTYLKSGSIAASNVAGKVVGAVGQKITDMTPELIKNIGGKLALSAGPNGVKLATQLFHANSLDTVGRNALLFSLSQNPEYRKMIKGILPDSE